MFEIFGIVFGGLLRLAPEVLKWLTRKTDNKHELDLIQANLDADLTRGDLAMRREEAANDHALSLAEISALLEANRSQDAPTGNKWIDGLSKSVRPVLTYYHCVLYYSAFKGAVFYSGILGGLMWHEVVLSMYTATDAAVMSSMIGYWFLDRSLRKGV